ncbi:MAG: hypothetical protein RL338_1402 [Chloroflexota bacterium]
MALLAGRAYRAPMRVLRAAPYRTGLAATRRTLPGLVIGCALVAAGVWLAVQELTTDVLADLALGAYPGSPAPIVAAIAWGLGFIVPVALVLLGASRLTKVLVRPRRSALDRFAGLVGDLPADHVVALGIRLPEGRRITALVLAPHGLAVFDFLPPPGALRQRHGRWEARIAGAGWRAIEEPLGRTRRDADAVRRWLWEAAGDEPADVRAAVIDESIRKRTPPHAVTVTGCSLIGPDGVRDFLAAMPRDRTFRPARYDRIVEQLKAAIV